MQKNYFNVANTYQMVFTQYIYVTLILLKLILAQQLKPYGIDE